MTYVVRTARAKDYEPIAAVVDDWWGRPILAALPRFFLDAFHHTSFVALDEAGMVGFLIGVLPPAQSDQAYIHFVGVRPDARSSGLARDLYQRFFTLATAAGARWVGAITGPANHPSIAFHARMGFTVTGPVPDYNGPGHDMMVFRRGLP
jgi:L-amino acid N-acyltransferase YncA